MDDEGTDGHFCIPTAWTSLVGHEDPTIEVDIIRAFHRHMANFAANHPDRLQSMIVASARDVDAAVHEIREWGKSRWAVAVMPLVTKDIPADHPSLDPIWTAADDHDLPIAHHSFTWTPPYFPGAFDLWDNMFLGRLAVAPVGRDAVHRLGDRRRHHGPLPRSAGRHPGMRLRLAAVLGQADGRAVRLCRPHPELKMKPSEYLKSGRYFCSVERHEGDDMFRMVTRFLGDDVLMYASDYPHSECQFPETVENFLAWQIKPEAARQADGRQRRPLLQTGMTPSARAAAGRARCAGATFSGQWPARRARFC